MIPSDLINTIQALKVAGIVCKGHFMAKKKSHIPVIPSNLLQLPINMTFIKELRRLKQPEFKANISYRSSAIHQSTWCSSEDLSSVPSMDKRQLLTTCSSNYREPNTSEGRQPSHPIGTHTGIHPSKCVPCRLSK